MATRMGTNDGPLIFVLAAIFCLIMLQMLLGSSRDDFGLQPRKANQDCTTELARDLYGLGVRLGIYLQWFSGWVSNTFIVDEINGGLDANAIFLTAILTAMIRSTRTDDITFMDGLIMLLLCAGTTWGVLSLWGYRTCVYRKEGLNGIRKFGGFGTHLRLLLGAGVSWYAIWYWSVGTEGLPKGLDQFGTVDDSCRKDMVTMFELPLKGIASNAALGVSSVSGAYSIAIVLATPIAAVTRVGKIVHFLRGGQYASTTRLRYATGATKEQMIVMSKMLCVFNLWWIIFAMVVIEFTLDENRATGVLITNARTADTRILEPSQLLPMLIGTFSFIRILFIAFEHWRSPDGDITPSLGRNASNRNAKAKRDSMQGLNILKLFSSSNAKSQECAHADESHDSQQTWDGEHNDAYYNLHSRLNTSRRILITVLPWFSLLWFWPWSEDIVGPVPQGEDTIALRPKPRNESISLQTPHRTRFADSEDEIDEDDTEAGYHQDSHVPLSDSYASNVTGIV
ncbi:hypothetical protein LTS08_002521 [Lithohypha guttulata]|nr:hypothetical protein LTS08_002521 [Lithohypha guttulata]